MLLASGCPCFLPRVLRRGSRRRENRGRIRRVCGMLGFTYSEKLGPGGGLGGGGGGCTQAGESRARGGDVLPARRARGVFVGVVKTRMTKLTLAERSLCSHDVPYMISFNYYSQLDPKSVEDLGSSEAYSSMQ